MEKPERSEGPASGTGDPHVAYQGFYISLFPVFTTESLQLQPNCFLQPGVPSKCPLWITFSSLPKQILILDLLSIIFHRPSNFLHSLHLFLAFIHLFLTIYECRDRKRSFLYSRTVCLCFCLLSRSSLSLWRCVYAASKLSSAQ